MQSWSRRAVNGEGPGSAKRSAGPGPIESDATYFWIWIPTVTALAFTPSMSAFW